MALEVKISELDELTDTNAADQVVIVDISEPNVTKRTKRSRMDNLKITKADQIADGVVANSKLAEGAVSGNKVANAGIGAGKIADGGVSATAQLADNIITESKLGTIKRTVIIKVVGTKDVVALENIPNVLAWSVSLNNFIVVDARINLAKASTSGSVTVALVNQGGTMATLSLAAGQTGMGESGVISTSYRKAITNAFLSVNITSAGTDAEGLSITLVLEGIPE